MTQSLLMRQAIPPKGFYETLANQPGRAIPIRDPGDKYRLKQNDISTTSQLQKQLAQRPPPRISNNNFPENKLQLNRHYLQVSQARPNPANAFR